jgi:hypothetical protein
LDWAAEWLLDDSMLGEVEPLVRRVSPRRVGMLVDEHDPNDLRMAIEYACQLWGGAATFLMPANLETGRIHPTFARRAEEAGITVFRRQLPETETGSLKTYAGWPRRIEPLLGAVLRDLQDTNRPRVTVALPEADSPWFLAYLVALGSWPDRPSPELLEEASLVSELTFEELLDLEFALVQDPSASDLFDRLQESRFDRPARASAWNLAPQARRWLPRRPTERRLPTSRDTADRIGPNIVVVYEPGSISDACLLWNLRALHGLPPGLPLAVPNSAALGEDLAHLTGTGAARPALFSEVRIALTSTTLPEAVLRSVARSEAWTVESADELLSVPVPPSRVSSEVGVFRNGRARVPLVAPTDAELLRRRPRQYGLFDVTSSFNRIERPMPDIPGLRREYADGFGSLGFEFDLRRVDQIGALEWPTGWVVLEAAVRDHGLRLRRSVPGVAAESLIRRLGGIGNLTYLAARPVIDRLHSLSERRAMSWFRNKVRELSALEPGDDRALAERIEAGLTQLALRAFEDEQHASGFRDFRADFGNDRDSASRWLRWAEQSGAVVKGADFLCEQCGASAWRSADEFGSAMLCRGCGARIGFPVGAEQLPFSYRASEAVVRAVEYDALPHVLALRWFVELFKPFPERPSRLYGGHPGVELIRGDGSVLAEIDVLLLLDDGSLVPGEVKRSGAGLKQPDLDKLDRVVEALASPWSFVATIDWASNCDEMWESSMKAGPAPRFALNGEDLLTTRVTHRMDMDFFAWAKDTDEQRTARLADFRAFMADAESWQSATRIPGRITLPEK